MSKRAERRHHRGRIIEKAKKQIKQWLNPKENIYPFRWRRRGGEVVVGQKEAYVEEYAARKAAAGTHTCEACRPPKYDRNDEKRADDFMDRIKCPTCGLTLRECDAQDCPPFKKGA